MKTLATYGLFVLAVAMINQSFWGGAIPFAAYIGLHVVAVGVAVAAIEGED